jgi:hypothetical protein
MPRTPNDERVDPTKPTAPERRRDLDNQDDEPAGGEARDQGDQTEDNRKQQE